MLLTLYKEIGTIDSIFTKEPENVGGAFHHL